MRDNLLNRLISPFPPDSIFRVIGKRFCRRLSIRQKFYNGVIYFDAVGQSWAFKGMPYETVDCQLKDELLSMSKECRHYIDIGCNIGQIALSVLLRNDRISAVCVDPNAAVLRRLKKSLRANLLEDRARVIQAAVGVENGTVHFTSEISELGHVSTTGRQVRCIRFADLINEHSGEECLVKIDVEGFETALLKCLGQLRNVNHLRLAVELHALGYNEGNPHECLRLLQESGAQVRRLDGLDLSDLDESKITQVIARWSR